jgi:hypothetical protein
MEQRGIKSKNAQEIKENKAKKDAEFNQGLEGLSIIGNNKMGKGK